jgi:hypothetical protein
MADWAEERAQTLFAAWLDQTPPYEDELEHRIAAALRKAAAREREACAALYRAATRLLELESTCDYVDGFPDVCPGVEKIESMCHWCELNEAVNTVRARAADAAGGEE